MKPEEFKIVEYRFAEPTDKYDNKYLDNWSRPYEYKFVMDFILEHKQEGVKIHNTSCGGHHNVHTIFRDELDKIGDCIHSDIKMSPIRAIQHYNITHESSRFVNKFDFVLNISTIEHLPNNRLTAIENLFKQVKAGGYLIITFDYPGMKITALQPLLKATCVKPRICLTGDTSVSPNSKTIPRHEIVFLVIKKLR